MGAGESIVIKGELQADEDLIVQGRVEGQINLKQHKLTVGSGARVEADIVASAVTVLGTVTGHLTAKDRIDIQPGGVVEGQLTTPKLVIGEGARFNGSVEMPTAGGAG